MGHYDGLSQLFDHRGEIPVLFRACQYVYYTLRNLNLGLNLGSVPPFPPLLHSIQSFMLTYYSHSGNLSHLLV